MVANVDGLTENRIPILQHACDEHDKNAIFCQNKLLLNKPLTNDFIKLTNNWALISNMHIVVFSLMHKARLEPTVLTDIMFKSQQSYPQST